MQPDIWHDTKQPYNPQHADHWLTVKSQNVFKPKQTTEESKNVFLIFILFCSKHQPLHDETHMKPSQPTCLLLADTTESVCTEPKCACVSSPANRVPQPTLLTTGTEALNTENLSMFKRFCIHPSYLFFFSKQSSQYLCHMNTNIVSRFRRVSDKATLW